MSGITSLTEFLESLGYDLLFWDMGRRIRLIPREDFVSFEQSLCPYPTPLQQQAWIALILNQPSAAPVEPLIWFLRFPLDEQGKLVLAARDEFLHRLVESAHEHREATEKAAALENSLQDNPYVFRPKAERLAVFHAKLTLMLQQPPSRYYAHARDYFSGKLGWEQWSFLGYQGIADMAARHAVDENTSILASAIPLLPPAPLEALCHCLENDPIPDSLAQALIQQGEQLLALETPDPRILSACVRAISCVTTEAEKLAFAHRLLSHPVAKQSEVLAAISGRNWELLSHDELREQFLSRLAENDQGQELFDNILSDLLFLPETRSSMLGSLRSETRSAALDAAIGRFFINLKER